MPLLCVKQYIPNLTTYRIPYHIAVPAYPATALGVHGGHFGYSHHIAKYYLRLHDLVIVLFLQLNDA